jgi:hypothetical protein
MTRAFNYTLLVIAALVIVACSSIPKVANSGDPLIVRAQQVARSLDLVITDYAKYEKSHRISLWRVSHDFKHAADSLRIAGPPALNTLLGSIDIYRDNSVTNRTEQLLLALQSAALISAQALNAFGDAKALHQTSK